MISYGMTVLDEEDWDMSGGFQAGTTDPPRVLVVLDNLQYLCNIHCFQIWKHLVCM